MALQSSGPISLGDINVELQRSRTSTNSSIHDAETGGGAYPPIRTGAYPKPNGSNPNALSEWYGYEHIVSTAVRYIGEYYGGGIVGYIYLPGDPGYDSTIDKCIILSTTALSNAAWDNGTHSLISGLSTGLDAGESSTLAIVNALGSGTYAAKSCYDATIGGYSDWFLPSFTELDRCIDYLFTVGYYLDESVIWTSSQIDANNAQIDDNGSAGGSGSKSTLFNVYPVRIISVPQSTTTYSATSSGAMSIHYNHDFSNLVLDSNQDDDYTLITLPFNIIFDGNTYSECYVGSNSYITFGSGSTVYYGLDVPTAPSGLPAIKLSSDDNSYQRIYTEVFETGTFTIRYEGTNITSGTAGSPNMVWEVTFYENSNKLNIAWGINSRGNSSSTGYGMTNGTTAIFQDVDAFTGEYVSYIIQ